MLNRLKKQSIKKLCIMGYNICRITALKILKGRYFDASLVQNIHPSTEIAISKGEMILSHSIFTRKYVSFRTDGGSLKIGTSFFNQGCCITAMNKVEIGDDCLFGPNVVIVDHDHNYHFKNNQRGDHWLIGEVIIGNNVWIGANVTILRGTRIGNGAVIGAGSVIKGEVEENTIIYPKQNYVMRKID